MNANRIVLLVFAAYAAAACATLPGPVPLVADAEGTRLLHGKWVGEYTSPQSGRGGSISFSLEQHDTTKCNVHAEHAHGDVLMIPQDAAQPLPPSEGWELGRVESAAPSVLEIQLIRVSGDRLTGTLQPYRDPDTGHPISTTFEGTIRNDEITGEFVSVDAQTGARMVGTWRVLRTST